MVDEDPERVDREAAGAEEYNPERDLDTLGEELGSEDPMDRP